MKRPSFKRDKEETENPSNKYSVDVNGSASIFLLNDMGDYVREVVADQSVSFVEELLAGYELAHKLGIDAGSKSEVHHIADGLKMSIKMLTSVLGNVIDTSCTSDRSKAEVCSHYVKEIAATLTEAAGIQVRVFSGSELDELGSVEQFIDKMNKAKSTTH